MRAWNVYAKGHAAATDRASAQHAAHAVQRHAIAHHAPTEPHTARDLRTAARTLSSGAAFRAAQPRLSSVLSGGRGLRRARADRLAARARWRAGEGQLSAEARSHRLAC